MNILVIGRGVPTLSYPMNGIFEYDQALALSKSNTVYYLALDFRTYKKKRRFGINIKKKSSSFCVIEANVPTGPRPYFLVDLIQSLVLKYVWKKLHLSNKKIDIIHSHFIRIGYITQKTLSQYNIPIIHTEHYSGMNEENISPYYKKIGNITYNNVDSVIAVSESFKININRFFNVSPKVIPNIVDTDIFSLSVNRQSEKFNFITVGRLEEIKNYNVLIDAVKKLSEIREDFVVRIIGNGSQRNHLLSKSINLGLEDVIFFMGEMTREEIAIELSQSDCFISTSIKETFGLSIVEALISGVPVISTKSGGPEDIICNNFNGILVENNVDSIVNAMLNMIAHYDRYDKKKIRDSAVKKYSKDNIINEINNIYRDIYK